MRSDRVGGGGGGGVRCAGITLELQQTSKDVAGHLGTLGNLVSPSVPVAPRREAIGAMFLPHVLREMLSLQSCSPIQSMPMFQP